MKRAWDHKSKCGEEGEEGFLHDVFGVSDGSSHPVRKAEQGGVMLVEYLQESRFCTMARCAEQIHAGRLKSITRRGGKE